MVFTEAARASDETRRRLLARADEAAVVLRGLGIHLAPLDGYSARALLERALDPDSVPCGSEIGLPGSLVTGAAE